MVLNVEKKEKKDQKAKSLKYQSDITAAPIDERSLKFPSLYQRGAKLL